MSESWDRQDGETEVAYVAFCAFRNMGADRSVVGVFRQQRGNKGAAKASGKWSRLVKAHMWHERALAWDHHVAAVRDRAIDRVTEDDTKAWARRRVARMERDFEQSEKLSIKIDGMIDGIDTPRDLKDAAVVVAAASNIAWAAIAQALPDTHVDFDPNTAPIEQLTEAIERLEAAIGPAPAHPRIAR